MTRGPRFVDELENADAHIARLAASGSPRAAHQLGRADPRFWLLARDPCLVVDVGRAEHRDLWRVLHAERDVPAWVTALRAFEPVGCGANSRS